MLACDRQTDRQAINGRNNGLERVQGDMELSPPVTDRQTHTQAINGKSRTLENPESHGAVLACDRQADRQTHRQSMKGTIDLRESRES